MKAPDFPPHVGDLWISYNSVRNTVGLVWGLFGAGLGPFGPQADLKSTPNDTDRTSENLKLRPHVLETHPQIAKKRPAGARAEIMYYVREHWRGGTGVYEQESRIFG